MSSPTANLSPSSEAEAKIYKVGTLTYSQQGLAIVFFWLIWNDFSFTLIESVRSLTNFLLRDQGASLAEIAWIGSLGLIFMWVNPVFSVWSDRFRSKWGRRRPFLFIVTPCFAFTLMGTPYMPDFYKYSMHYAWVRAIMSHVHMSGPIFFIAILLTINVLFNDMLQTIFSYLYWDVVPQIVLGRFQAMMKIAGALAGILWNAYFMSLADFHMKGVYVGVSLSCLIVYLLSVFMVKEGDYPPPDAHKKGGTFFAPIRAYFVECFSDSFYVWMFVGFSLIQIGNLANNIRPFYLREDLHMNLGAIGQYSTPSQIVMMLLGFGVGSLADKLKPVRLMFPTYLAWATANVGAYLFVTDKWSYLFWFTLINIAIFSTGVTYGAFVAEMYPRAKLGQFCSANATTSAVVTAILNPGVGWLFDTIHFNRFCFLFSGIFEFLGAVVFLKVYYNWKKRQGRIIEPHAG